MCVVFTGRSDSGDSARHFVPLAIWNAWNGLWPGNWEKWKPAWLFITIADYLLNRRSLCKDFNSCFELFALLVMGRIKISNKELVLESVLYIHKQTWKKERLKKKSKIKILPRPGLFIIHHSEFLDESLWEMQKNMTKHIVPRPGIIQSSCQRALRIWTRDLQIFSLTLSQLSYLGNRRLLRENITLLVYTI